jgi:NAD-dependent dihydropyrimidine dehydrogenase PreA subunit
LRCSISSRRKSKVKIKRQIIRIDEELCDGCELCIPACPEGALQIIDGKAKLVKEGFCDGLGACLGDCPQGALTIEEKITDEYDEDGVIDHLKETAPERLEAHLEHLREHGGVEAGHASGAVAGDPRDSGATDPARTAEGKSANTAAGGSAPSAAGSSVNSALADTQEPGPRAPQCPSARLMQWKNEEGQGERVTSMESHLRQWPIQLHLVSPIAPYFKNADLALIADCIPFAYANFHNDFMTGNSIAIACPKLDDTSPYVEKLSQIVATGDVKSMKVVIMEVPCCSGLVQIAREALTKANKSIPFEVVVVGIKGQMLKRAAL